MRNVIVFIACSVDGYIAKPGDDLSFLSIAESPGEDYGYSKFVSSVDTVLMGRKTYDWVMGQVEEFPHAGKQTFVRTRSARPDAGDVHFYTGDFRSLVFRLKNETGMNIFCDGGAETIHFLLRENLIDEFIISVVPVLVGAGTRLFLEGNPECRLELVEQHSYATGVVQTHYRVVR